MCCFPMVSHLKETQGRLTDGGTQGRWPVVFGLILQLWKIRNSLGLHAVGQRQSSEEALGPGTSRPPSKTLGSRKLSRSPMTLPLTLKGVVLGGKTESLLVPSYSWELTPTSSPPGLRKQPPGSGGGPGLSAEHCPQRAPGKANWLHVAPTSPSGVRCISQEGKLSRWRAKGLANSEPSTGFFPGTLHGPVALGPGQNPKNSVLLCPSRGAESSRKHGSCPIAPQGWVFGFPTFVDFAWLCPWSVRLRCRCLGHRSWKGGASGEGLSVSQ